MAIFNWRNKASNRKAMDDEVIHLSEKSDVGEFLFDKDGMSISFMQSVGENITNMSINSTGLVFGNTNGNLLLSPNGITFMTMDVDVTLTPNDIKALYDLIHPNT